MKRRAAASLVVAAIFLAWAAYAGFQAAQPAPTPLSTFVPQGSLLSIESPNFAALLQRWTDSAEQKRWLASDDYAGFSRSRLFGRLADAQNEFATTAGLAPDAHFLAQIAGTQSLFAWYDVGNLEFLYITRMAPGEAEKTTLYRIRDKFQERKAGDTAFYIRSQGPQDQPQQQDPAQQNRPQMQSQRTVAFAVRGDYLLLATREDLIAGALDLMQNPVDRTLQNEPWYASSIAAANRQPGDLRMALNLARIVPSPYFRSYWIQQNITEFKQYSSALSDLYLDKQAFREERILVPIHTFKVPVTADLAPVLAYVPSDRGVFRAQASPSTAEILAQMEDKLFTRNPAPYRDWRDAPEADISVPSAGGSSQEFSLEQFIDEPLPIDQPRSAALQPLADLFNSAQPSAMLVFSSAIDSGTSADATFAPIHNAVVLAASSNWDSALLQRAITAALSPTLSVSQQGLAWAAQQPPQQTSQTNVFELAGPGGLVLAVRGQVCILASDRATLLSLIRAAQAAPRTAQVAAFVGGFRPAAERPSFVRLTALLDHSNTLSQSPAGNTPPFFSGNVASLLDTFSDLKSEAFTETPSRDGNGIQQTVIYQW